MLESNLNSKEGIKNAIFELITYLILMKTGEPLNKFAVRYVPKLLFLF